ncbi:hypothetical protein [Rathayibacter sp. VKM Ac-2801]|uniref:hypothetical protein n=1 Tax=Rathayibacter sp. VKM Ac-2801 TaxID=2609255 RepID=UPI0013200E2D|nr:hypothetical protein [Rathayibacter sp. VKM Ac-2801]QHC70781.1 hypothetical protein GSU45_10665 [Rathayibacter sp. VKM Ac-2801]
MIEIELGIRRTPARVAFKRNTGQNNHFLITVLVGLDAVRDGEAKLAPEFSTSWSPTDVRRSAIRSREYALVTSIAWITDLVDVYRKRLQAMRSVMSDAESKRIDKIDGRAVRLSELASVLGIPRDDRNLLMMLFATKWRNTIVHSDADSRIGSDLRNRLLNSAQDIALEHRGLDVSRSIKSFERGDAPTFKEVASFVAAGQQLVAALDVRAITKMNVQQYAESILSTHLSAAFTLNAQVYAQYWSGNQAKTHKRLTTLLAQLGFTRSGALSQLSAEYLDSTSRLTAHAARARFSPREGH